MLVEPAAIENDSGFIRLTAEPGEIDPRGIIQQVDDCGKGMKFEHANIYDSKRPQRVTRHIVLPYRLAQSSRNYTLYERISE